MENNSLILLLTSTASHVPSRIVQCLARKGNVKLQTSHYQLANKVHERGVFRHLFVDDFDHSYVVREETDTRITEKMTPYAYRQYNGK